MDLPEKWKLYLLLALGRREQALQSIRETYRVSDEEAGKLLQAVAVESPLRRWIGTGCFVTGLILLAIGTIRFFAFAPNDERHLAISRCTVTDVRAIGEEVEVTFAYAYNGIDYSNTERSRYFRDMRFQQGQVLELWVNMDNPKEVLLPVLKPVIQSTGLMYGGVGLVLIVLSVFLWRVRKIR